MSLVKSTSVNLKTNWMRLFDQVAETKIRILRAHQELNKPFSLEHDFDPKRIKFYWPSFYFWPLTYRWLRPLLIEFQRNFDLEFKPLPIHKNAVYLEVEVDGQVHPIAIDRFDKVVINEEVASQVEVYFKMQYSTDGYAFDNVVPGGFVPGYSSVYLHLDKLRAIRSKQEFLYDVYGRFGGRFAKEIRGQAVDLVSSQREFSYHGGIGKVSYKNSLFEVARSKVCLDMPGMGPLCFRLIDYLAVGACVIAYPHQARFPVPLTPGKEIIYCKEDLSDLNELCEYYITHEEERETIARNARAYFDRHLSRRALASYYVNTILDQVVDRARS